MIERVDARCKKCGLTFSTGAQTRTTCPVCKAAVTVRRGESLLRSVTEHDKEDVAAGDLAGGVGVIVVLVILVGSWIWRGLRGGDADS